MDLRATPGMPPLKLPTKMSWLGTGADKCTKGRGAFVTGAMRSNVAAL